jgi:hypothetical protein
MATIIQHRRGTAAQWTSENPTLAEGELGLITDTGRYKIGDGVTAWASLGYPPTSPVTTLTTYESSAEPSAPDPGELHIYANNSAGRMLPRFKGPSGLDSAIQPALFGNGFFLAAPGTTTAMNVIGGPTLTTVGTMSHPIPVSSSLRQQTSRAQILSAATIDSVASTRLALNRVWRGDAAGLGGFFYRLRFAINSSVATQRCFFGLHPNSVIALTATPSNLLNIVGIGNDGSGEPNLQVLINSASGTADKIDLGANFPSQGVDDTYELTLFAPPNADHINYRVQRFVTGATASGTLSGAKLPQVSAFLAPYAYMNNGGTAAAVSLDVMRIYLETDY